MTDGTPWVSSRVHPGTLACDGFTQTDVGSGRAGLGWAGVHWFGGTWESAPGVGVFTWPRKGKGIRVCCWLHFLVGRCLQEGVNVYLREHRCLQLVGSIPDVRRDAKTKRPEPSSLSLPLSFCDEAPEKLSHSSLPPKFSSFPSGPTASIFPSEHLSASWSISFSREIIIGLLFSIFSPTLQIHSRPWSNIRMLLLHKRLNWYNQLRIIRMIIGMTSADWYFFSFPYLLSIDAGRTEHLQLLLHAAHRIL